MLKLTRLIMKNFFSHKDTTIDLTEKRGLVLIEGRTEDGRYDSNGSGKSTILEGIVYALSGNTLRNVGVNDVVNRKEKKNTKVQLDFYQDGISYSVSRYRKDKEHGDSLVVLKNGENISRRLNKDTQELLDGIVGVPYKVLVSTVLLGEGLSSRFTQLSDPEKKSLIESTLNLQYDLGKCKDIVSDRLKSLKWSQAECTGKISTLQSTLEVDVDSLRREIEHSESLLITLRSSDVENEKQIEAQRAVVAPIDAKINVIQGALRDVQMLNYQLSSLDTEVANYVKEITHLCETPTPVCSHCHQPISSESVKQEMLQDLKKKVSDGTEQMKVWQSQLNNLPTKEILEEKLASLYELTKTSYDQLNKLYYEQSEIRTSITTESLKISHNRSLLEAYSQNQSAYEEAQATLRQIESEIREYEYLQKLFSPTGLLVAILQEASSYINERIRVYSEILLDKSYSISFEKGKITLQETGKSTYQSLSNGEKRRLDIALQFSLHDYVHTYCGLKFNILFIDEVLDTLDETGVNNIIEVLNMKREYCGLTSVFVITHNSSLKTMFDTVITVSKDIEGISRII